MEATCTRPDRHGRLARLLSLARRRAARWADAEQARATGVPGDPHLQYLAHGHRERFERAARAVGRLDRTRGVELAVLGHKAARLAAGRGRDVGRGGPIGFDQAPYLSFVGGPAA